MLTDEQRVDRYNDYRAFQLLVQNNFSSDVLSECHTFLCEQKNKRTQNEILSFYEAKMDQLSEKKILKESNKTIIIKPEEIVEDEVDENYGTYFDLLFDSQEKLRKSKESIDE